MYTTYFSLFFSVESFFIRQFLFCVQSTSRVACGLCVRLIVIFPLVCLFRALFSVRRFVWFFNRIEFYGWRLLEDLNLPMYIFASDFPMLKRHVCVVCALFPFAMYIRQLHFLYTLTYCFFFRVVIFLLPSLGGKRPVFS